jgi:hypothetical protein
MINAEHGGARADPEDRVITFEVVKEPYGWSIRRDARMMTPVWCKALAVQQASRMVAVLRRHGAPAELRIDDAEA